MEIKKLEKDYEASRNTCDGPTGGGAWAYMVFGSFQKAAEVAEALKIYGKKLDRKNVGEHLFVIHWDKKRFSVEERRTVQIMTGFGFNKKGDFTHLDKVLAMVEKI